jgi:PAS domain S-box-containing protein
MTSLNTDDHRAEYQQATREELVEQLREAQETLDAIRNGEVDAVVVGGASGQQVYTLESADRPYRLLIEQMREGAVTLSHDNTILYCNEWFAIMVKMRRERLLGMHISQFIALDDAGAFDHLIKDERQPVNAMELTLKSADGSLIPVNVSTAELENTDGLPRIICMVVTDLTNSRQRSHDLAASNLRLAREIEDRRRAEDGRKLALEAAAMGSWELDLVADRLTWSSRFGEIFGLTKPIGPFAKADLLERFVVEDVPFVSSAFSDALSNGLLNFEKRIVRATDQVTRWAHVQGRTYFDAGKPVRLAGVISDVTDRRMIDEQLRQAQKMEAIGQLTGGIAHDFNNLLMVIGGSLDVLERRMGSDPRTKTFMDIARHGVDRGAKLNQQLLAFSRRQDLRLEAVHVDELIASFETLLDRAIGEAIILDIEHGANGRYCMTDPHQLETAILNLAINARDAMPNGGHLLLSTAVRNLSPGEALLHDAPADEYVTVTLKDNGIGMGPDVIAKIFEPFFTTKATGKGTGLGLSQVYGFARQSGGFVTVQSEPQCGTSIALHLPRSEVEAAELQVDATSNELEFGSGTVLLVEDDSDVREVTATLLRDLGYRVLEADGALAALALIDSGIEFDLVFTDVIMPGDMNGVDLAHEIRRRHVTMPVLITSGYTAQRFASEERLEGLELLRKPYSRTDLASTVRSMIQASKA